MTTPMAGWAKKKPTPTGLELQQIQSRDIEGSKKVVFGAVMSVLQDSGYRIQAADKETGLITGVASTKAKLTWMPFVGFGSSKKSPVVSAFIEDKTVSITRVRLSFVMAKVRSTFNYGTAPEDEDPIYDPQVYQDAFEKINQAVFIRLNAEAPPAPTPTSATTPVATSTTPVTAPETAKPTSTTVQN
ncbi:MAG: hypothetical protein ABI810_11640 [Sphingomonas bacterium]